MDDGRAVVVGVMRDLLGQSDGQVGRQGRRALRELAAEMGAADVEECLQAGNDATPAVKQESSLC